MMQIFENQQPSLLEPRGSRRALRWLRAQTMQLATLLEALLAEIAATLGREVGDEQDHQ